MPTCLLHWPPSLRHRVHTDDWIHSPADLRRTTASLCPTGQLISSCREGLVKECPVSRCSPYPPFSSCRFYLSSPAQMKYVPTGSQVEDAGLPSCISELVMRVSASGLYIPLHWKCRASSSSSSSPSLPCPCLWTLTSFSCPCLCGLPVPHQHHCRYPLPPIGWKAPCKQASRKGTQVRARASM